MSSGKPSPHDRKTPTHRDSVPAKSPVSQGESMPSHSPFDPHHRAGVPGEVYRAHLPPHLDPATLAFHRVIDPGRTPASLVNPGRAGGGRGDSMEQRQSAAVSFIGTTRPLH